MKASTVQSAKLDNQTRPNYRSNSEDRIHRTMRYYGEDPLLLGNRRIGSFYIDRLLGGPWALGQPKPCSV